MTPATTPVVGLTVATPGVPLLHVPPILPSELRLMLDPVHTVVGPVIRPATGVGLIVTVKEVDALPQPFE